MIEANRYKLGIFLTIGIFLILGAIFIFGVSKFFEKKVTIVTVFNESVDGLSKGSPVKYRGVAIGSVKRIKIMENGNIEVFMSMKPNVLTRGYEKKQSWISNFNRRTIYKQFLKKLKNQGYRCTLQLRGLTGQKYIGIKHFEDHPPYLTKSEVSLSGGEDRLYLPSTPSFISGALDDIRKTLNDIASMKLKKLGVDIEETLESINTLTVSVNKLVDSIQYRDLNKTLLHTLTKIDNMSEAVKELAKHLDKKPESLIKGSGPEVDFDDE